MKLIFLHHEIHGPLSLEDLWKGTHRFAGTVSRLRILFWLAARGHEVILAGNATDGLYRHVRSVSGTPWETLLPPPTPGSPLPVLILCSPPSEDLWKKILDLKNRCSSILWVANPLPHPIWMSRTAAGFPNRIVCISQFHRDLYRIYRGFPSIEVCYLGIDTDLMEQLPSLPPTRPTALFCSIPRRTKGVHHLLRLWPIVRRRIPDALLRICGSAQMHDPQARVGRTGILDADIEAEFPDFFGSPPDSLRQHGIELTGALGLPEAYAAMKSATLAVVNCNFLGAVETYCRSAVEAQLAGIPVVGAASGSLPEVVRNGETGLLAPNHRSLADAVIRLFEDPDLRKSLGEAGRRNGARFADYEGLAGEWNAILERTVRNEPAPQLRRWFPDILRTLGYGSFRAWGRNRLRNLRVERFLLETLAKR